ADVLETGQRPEARRAIRLDSIDPVNPGRPERVAFSGETEESHRLDRIVTILGEVAGHLLAVRFGVEPLHLVSTNLNDAALRLEVNEAHRYRDAIGLPRLGGDAIDRITCGVEGPPAKISSRIALDHGNPSAAPFDAPQTAAPLSGVETDKNVIGRNMDGGHQSWSHLLGQADSALLLASSIDEPATGQHHHVVRGAPQCDEVIVLRWDGCVDRPLAADPT